MAKNPRNYPDTIPSAGSGRPMTRGEKLVTFKIEGRAFTYKQPGWWCSLRTRTIRRGSWSTTTTRSRKWPGARQRRWRMAKRCSCRS